MEFINNIHINKRNRIIAIINDIQKNPSNCSLDGILKFFKIIFKEDFRKYIKIQNTPNFNFPSHEINKITFSKEHIIIDTNRFGVTHLDSNIQNDDIEKFAFLETSNEIDKPIADFINIFNNQLLHCSFNISEKFSPSLSAQKFIDSFYGNVLNSLSGNIFSIYKELSFNNINSLWGKDRTNYHLKKILSNLTNLEINISSANGGFEEIDENLLILNQANNALSLNAYLGKYIFNPTKYIDIFIKIDFNYLLHFIYIDLKNIFNFIKSYLHFIIDFRIKLLVSKTTIEPLDIKSNKIFLGLNSFLTSNNHENFENKIYLHERLISKILDTEK